MPAPSAHEALGYRAKGLFTSLRTDWATPRQLFAMLDAQFHFTLDVCATLGNLPREGLEHFSTNSLARRWLPLEPGSIWCNPPYGRQIGKWVAKGYSEAQADPLLTVVMLLPARTDTSWWHDYCMRGEIVFLRGRLCFDENPRKRAPFPSAVVVFSQRPPESALRLR